MKTNTEINTWEIRDNKYNIEGTGRPKCWKWTDRIASVSNIEFSDKELSDLANSYITYDLVKIKVGDTEIIVPGTDLIIAVENAIHSYRRLTSNRYGGPRNRD